MRKLFPLIAQILLGILCLCLICTGYAEVPSVDLSTFSLAELTQFQADIRAENRLHHETDAEVEAGVLEAVKAVTEDYYAAQGITVSWAWYGWEYSYSRNYDFLTFSSHLDYEDAEKKSHRVDVAADLYYDGLAYNVYQLFLNKEQVLTQTDDVPDTLLVDTGHVTINRKTGINLSLLQPEDLKELDGAIEKEIQENHKPHNSSQVNGVLKKTVEAHFAEQGVTVSWPWFDYDYTCDWDCYTEKTRISYELDGVRHTDEPVYAEIFPEDGGYQVCYLTVGDTVLIDQRSTLTSENALLFLHKRTYEEAMQAFVIEKYEEARTLFESLGDFDDSPEMAAHCTHEMNRLTYEQARSLMDGAKYEEAISIFDSLGDFADSQVLAAQCRTQLQDMQYLDALMLMQSGDYENAIQRFNVIPDYMDSQQRILECQTAISERQYSLALDAMANGNYEEAIQRFEALDGYSESETRIAECQEAISEREYNLALDLMAEGRYEEAISRFESLNGYSGSEAKIQACRESLNSQAYLHAEKLFSDGLYSEARDAFAALGDYRDSQERTTRLQDILASIDREIRFEESELFLFPGKKATLASVVTPLREDAPENTGLVYTSDDPGIARVARDGTVTAGKAGDAVIHCEAADNPYISRDITVHVVKSVSRVVLTESRVTLSVPEQNGNSTTQLAFRLEPEDAHIQTGVWSSGNEQIATVDQDGYIHATGTGRAIITFTSDDTSKGKKAASCTVSVVQAVTALELPESSGTVFVGKPVQLKPVIQPKNAANKKLTWSSSDESIATVSANGQIRGLMPGEVVITAASADGPTVSYRATVKMPPVTLKVTGSAKCIAKNHVGNRWQKEFYLNGEVFKGTGKVTVENGDTISVGCEILEDDKDPDWDSFMEEIEITPEIMKQGLKIERTLWVTENAGRYAGESAEWSVVITIRP